VFRARAEEEEGKKDQSTEFIVFWAREEEEIYALFEHLKDDRQKLFKYFRMGILKSEKFKQLLYTDN
jgi:hypothetical protein